MHRMKRFGRLGGMTLIVLVVFCLGTRFQPQSAVRAGVREITPRESFLAGDQRSLPVLQEISATLKQIDARLARIEKVVVIAAGREGTCAPAGRDP